MAEEPTEDEVMLADGLRRALGTVVRSIVSASEPVAAGQLEALGYLVREGPMSIATLARRRRVRHQSMSATVGELEAAGMVSRSPDPSDARGILVVPTDDGRRAVEQSRRSRATTIALAVREFTAEQRAVLESVPPILEQLAATVDGANRS